MEGMDLQDAKLVWDEDGAQRAHRLSRLLPKTLLVSWSPPPKGRTGRLDWAGSDRRSSAARQTGDGNDELEHAPRSVNTVRVRDMVMSKLGGSEGENHLPTRQALIILE